MVHVDQVLRANKNVLLNVLDTFIHDPLVDWIVSSAKEKASSRTVQGAVDVGEAENPEAAKSMTLIKNRLNGLVTEHGLPLAVQGHVEHLIEEATSQENLSRMYRWWMPWY